MEKKRAYQSGRICAIASGGFSPIFVTAAVSVLAFMTVLGWRIETALHPGEVAAPSSSQERSASLYEAQAGVLSDPTASSTTATAAATTSQDAIGHIGDTVMAKLVNSYVGLQGLGLYSTSTAQAAGESALPLLSAEVEYKKYSAKDVKTTADTSYDRMLMYRSDLQTSLEPLLKNTQAEYEIFAYYLQTGDKTYLDTLATVAQNYRNAAKATVAVVAPIDALDEHVGILNAMEEFAAVLDALRVHADDPFASAALLRSYNTAEADMVTTFNALATYYRSKLP